MSTYAANIEKMEAQLTEWSTQIRLLEANIESASSSVKLQRAKELNDLRAKQRKAVATLNEMKKATVETWGQVKGAADKIWDDLKSDIANAHANVM